MHKEWKIIKEDINNNINTFKIERWIGTHVVSDIELHAFSDATPQAYACVIYCKINIEGQTKIVLLAGKSRLVPNSKTVTLPRAELCGAHLLAKLMIKIKQCLNNHNIKVYGWVDSTAVLGWLQGDPNRWNTFVANRVRQITEVIPPECWRYVKSAENPSDCASRGLTASQLKQHTLWWQGPTWLPTFQADKYDKQMNYPTHEEQNIPQVHVAVNAEPEDNLIDQLINKYSSFSKLIHVLAWVRRFISKKQDRKSSNYLHLSELREASTLIIKRVQKTEFQEEYQELKKSRPISTKSNILDLCPFIDEEGVLRVKGRLRNAYITFDMKHPIILPHKHRLTSLIIDHAHKMALHGPARTTLNFIRNKYWIVGGNSATKQFIRHCVICKKQKANMRNQIMGDLPAARSNPSRPFEHTGVDFTGHVFLKANKGRGIKTTKGYVCVFVCMATKAVHLELVSDMTASAFIAALRRMAARRGTPLHIYSDNGRNFLKASKILKEEYLEIQNVVNTECQGAISDMGITWHFNAPAWPSAGGLWEGCVKVFKYHLKRVIGEQKLTYEEFSSLLAQIEGCMNSRPLCAISEDPDDINYLTPSHFLSSGPTLTLIETERDLRTRWQLTQKIFQDLWKRWRSEYLALLNSRSKWKKSQDNISINDVVLIHDDNLPPGKWAMGRVIELHPGQDGYVRVVTLKTKNGTLKRPVVKLSLLLEHTEEEPRIHQSNSLPERDTDKQNSTRSYQKPKANKATLSSIFAVLLLLLSCLTTGQCDVNIIPFRETQGLYFDKLANMLLIRDEWKLVVYYNMEPYWDATNALQKYSRFLKDTCATIKTQVHCDVILLQLRHGFSELEYYNEILLSQHSSTRQSSLRTLRTRRGLADGVGYLANSLFGVLDARFAEQYRRDIALLQHNAQHMASLWKNQTSVVEAEYNLLKRSEDTMNQQHKMINQHMNNLEEAFKNLQHKVETNNIVNDFNLGTIIASNMLHNLKGMQDMLLDTVTDIHQGRFNPHVLTPEQLINELSAVASNLPRDVSLPIDNLHTDLRKIYNLLKVKARMMDDVLIFEIRLPLVSRDIYELLRIIPIPKRTGNKITAVIPVSEYVSINMKKDMYIPVSENDIRACTISSDSYFCYIKKPVYQLKGDNSFCESDKSGCKTASTTCTNNWIESNALNTYIYFCCAQCQVRTLCADQVTAHQLTNAGLINKNESEDLQRETSELGEKIEQLKTTEVNAETISYHDIHHYAMIYVILGVIGTTALFIIIRRTLGKMPPTPSRHIAEEPPAATPPPPRASPRSVVVTEAHQLSDEGHCDTSNPSRLDKATSPSFKVVTFS
ncbi:uncharacterized protein LOC125225360 [Leguminivora glycinivorella]|uniref:uncharacterized protein LOC125225360 n=1 Tax=Leguminivora glycinivorella TaxID=1035111 RepID=UPI00200E255B|nr:uncharacterized protein LOC125225360 [Leguminivora glycinivorella]